MKTQSLFLSGLLGVALIAAGGCGKQDSSTATPSPGSAVEKAVANAQSQTEVVKQKAQEAATNVQAQATAITGQAQTLISDATKLVAEKKWPEALALLKKMSGQPLPADLQSIVQTLKEQAQKGLESMASAPNAGALLPK